MKKKLIEMYLDYWNDFLSVAGYASYYGLEEKQAHRIINLGRELFKRKE